MTLLFDVEVLARCVYRAILSLASFQRRAVESELVRASLYQMEPLLSQQTVPMDTAVIFIEPVLGEGGCVPAPPTFLQGLRAICDKHGFASRH